MNSVSEQVAWPQLPADLAEIAITPDNAREYSGVRSSYMKVGSPHVVLLPRTEAEAAAVVTYAAAVRAVEPVPFSVRSGGHGIAGTSTNDGGIILDLRRLNRVQVIDAERGLVQAQAGAIWGDVALTLAPYGLALTSGNFGDTGVGGLATAAGIGYLARSQGLTIDRVRSAYLLTADGAMRWVDEESEPDLFWAVRGGGSQVGIVLEFIFEATRLGSVEGQATVLDQEIQYLIEDLPVFTEKWGAWIRTAPREMESFLMIQQIDGARFVVQARNVWSGDNTDVATPVLTQALQLAQVMRQTATLSPYGDVVPTPRSAHTGQQRIVMRDVLVDDVDASLGRALAASTAHSATLLAEVRALGGAVADVPSDATAWAGRHQEALVGIWAQPVPEADVDAAFAPLQNLGTGAYGAYSSDLRSTAAELAWPGSTGDRLRALSERVDPEGLFTQGLTLRNPQ